MNTSHPSPAFEAAIVVAKEADSWILRAADVTALGDADFEPQALSLQGRIIATQRGRGVTYFVTPNPHSTQERWVLRHYRRGGFIGKWNRDLYFALALNQTRAYRELALLNELYQRALPVPRPIGARVKFCSGFYRADLITQAIPEAIALADWPATDWTARLGQSVGQTIRRFHAQGIWHADLNAKNILLTPTAAVYLIDFDRSARRPLGDWTQGNVRRLHRSLVKLACDRQPGFDDFWRALDEAARLPPL